MKTTRLNILTYAMLAGASLLWSACSDTWGDHYDGADGSMADQPSLLSTIQNDAELANFYKVITSIGGAETLDSPQQLTVWAPKSLTAAQADSIIAVYNKDAGNGVKMKDNKALFQFLQNHVALFARPVSAYTNDTVCMLNKKYMQLVGTSTTSGTLNGNKFSDMKLCNNGILYKMDNVQSFYPNVREYVDKYTQFDSLSNFIASYDEYELDENSSVAGGIVDGKTVYLDSVTNLTNDLLTEYGYIQREDSTYSMIAPTSTLWNKLFAKYSAYYQYASTQAQGAKKTLENTRKAIICGRIFDTSSNWTYNLHPEDSLCNTQYKNVQTHNPRSNVFYNPNEGILKGLEKVQCSNGYIYVDNTAEGVIDPTRTFFGRKDQSCNFNYEITKDEDGKEISNVSSGQTYYKYIPVVDELTGDTVDYEQGASYSYIKVSAKASSDHSQLTYTIPNTLSGCYYNIYLVTVPNEEDNLPSWFSVCEQAIDADGTLQYYDGTNWSKTKQSYLSNPNPVTEDQISTSAVKSNRQRYFYASAEKVDTILLQKAVTFPVSGYDLTEGVVKLYFTSNGPNSATYKNKVYTRTLRLNEIIMLPFETKDEAEEAADAEDALDRFNDVILEAKQQK